MSALAAPISPRAARVIQSGLWLLALLNLARAVALWRQADWLTGLPLSPDPRLRLALAFLWALLFAAAAATLRAARPPGRRLVSLLLVAYGVVELSMTLGFTSTPLALPSVALYTAFAGFAGLTLWPPPARALSHPSEPRPKEVADRRTL